MLKYIKMANVGPAPKMEITFGERLNLLTGDNGLGKSFLLDVAWWAMTRKWPAEINPTLTAGKKALPTDPGDATICFSFNNGSDIQKYGTSFSRKKQAWTGPPGRPENSALVLYAMADGFRRLGPGTQLLGDSRWPGCARTPHGQSLRSSN